MDSAVTASLCKETPSGRIVGSDIGADRRSFWTCKAAGAFEYPVIISEFILVTSA
jgi:hypothetical protein